MIRILSALLIAVLFPLQAVAQVPEATPVPNYQIYDDLGMHFEAPKPFVPVAQRKIGLATLGDDPQIVAGWVVPDRDSPKRMLLEMESYQGPVDEFDGVFEQQIRGTFEGALFKNKTPTRLKNGMPALSLEMSSGSGFDAVKAYMTIWCDGQRGVALIVLAPLGSIDATTAKAYMSDVSAVRYPVEREQSGP